jgi:hypothetical protein
MSSKSWCVLPASVAVTLDPSYPEARYVLAQAHRRLGRAADAEREFKAFRDARARAPAVRR